MTDSNARQTTLGKLPTTPVRSALVLACSLLIVISVFLPASPPAQAVANTNSAVTPADLKPTLSIDIPTIRFSDVVISDVGGEKTVNIPWLAQYLSGAYKFAVGIGAFLAAVMMLIGGFMYLTAGDSSRTSRGKEMITDALLGLAVILGSFVMLQLVNPNLTTLDAIKVPLVDKSLFETNEGKDSESGSPGATNGSAPPMPTTQLDTVFQAYASCYGLDWRVLKAVAKAESGLNSSKINASGYQGLFQMKKGYCTGGIGKFSSFLNCNDLLDPEAGTAAAAATMSATLKKIEQTCPTASAKDKALILYTGHNNGPGVAYYLLRYKACNESQQKEYVGKYYETVGEAARKDKMGSNYTPCTADKCGPKGCVCAAYGIKKWEYGKTAAAAMQSSGVTNFFPPGVDSSKCPAKTGKRVFPK